MLSVTIEFNESLRERATPVYLVIWWSITFVSPRKCIAAIWYLSRYLRHSAHVLHSAVPVSRDFHNFLLPHSRHRHIWPEEIPAPVMPDILQDAVACIPCFCRPIACDQIRPVLEYPIMQEMYQPGGGRQVTQLFLQI